MEKRQKKKGGKRRSVLTVFLLLFLLAMYLMVFVQRYYAGQKTAYVTLCTMERGNVEGVEAKDYFCIPVEAVKRGENGVSYVWLAEETKSILGNELVSRRAMIRELGRDEEKVAIPTNSLSNADRIIRFSDRELSDGSRVRMS